MAEQPEISPEPGATCVMTQGRNGPLCGQPAVTVLPVVNPGTGEESGIALCATHRDMIARAKIFGLSGEDVAN